MRKIFESNLSSSFNLLSTDSELMGDISIKGDFRFDGKLKGNITCNGKLTLGKTSYVEGNIICNDVEIFGEVKGYIKSSGLVIIKEKSSFSGEIETFGIIVDNNSNINMKCTTLKVD